MVDVDVISGYGGDIFRDGYGGDLDICGLTDRDEETGLVHTHVLDDQATIMLQNGRASEHDMLKVVLKLMIYLHFNTQKCLDTNKRIEKALIAVEVKNTVATHNGRLWVAFQVAGGSINLIGGILASSPTHAHSLLGRFTDMSHYNMPRNWSGNLTEKGQEIGRLLGKQISSTVKQFAQTAQVATSIEDSRNQGHRTQASGNTQTLQTAYQQSGQRVEKESNTASEGKQLLQRLEEQLRQVIAAMTR